MFVKCAIILFLSVVPIDYLEAYSTRQRPCPPVRLLNGQIRKKGRAKLVRFTCDSGYELAGNKYATCMNGDWDVPMPVCVKTGCQELPTMQYGFRLKNHKGAWVVTFCLPGYKLVGSPAIYCDGENWNGTAPRCVDENAPSNPTVSCDFESEDLCGWTQDELHDFDWKRWNRNTPSYYIKTGPSYDHTLGEGRDGHYMYLESTGLPTNATARLISPIVDADMSVDACFSFFYHMYGRNMGGLKVYMVLDRTLQEILMLPPALKEEFRLFEQWGNQGDRWIGVVKKLKPMTLDFQIIIEGVQGNSYANDIAFDDVAILKGENCTRFSIEHTDDNSMVSCQNRCKLNATELLNVGDCSCSRSCMITYDCCDDFLELCVWGSGANNISDDSNPTDDYPPQTEKLIYEVTTFHPNTTPPFFYPTYAPISPAIRTTTTISPPTMTKPPTTTTKPPTTTTKPPTTMTKRPTTTTKRPTTTTKQPTTTTTTTKQPTNKLVSTTPVDELLTVEPLLPITKIDYEKINKEKNAEEIYIQKMHAVHDPKHKKSSPGQTAVITIVVLALVAGLVYIAYAWPTARGWVTLARLRATLSNDPEVRFLTTNDDDL